MAKVIVIGAGPAGLTTAIHAAKNGNDVIILEKNNKCGKKLNITGNGHCNYYNEDQNIIHYHSHDEEFLSSMITDDNKNRYLSFFKSLGVIPNIKNGYYYPMSNQATSITNALVDEALKNNVKIINYIEVKAIKNIANEFKVITDNKEYFCQKVVIATGSKAYPKTGSDGSGYELLKALGHTTTDIYPSLVQVKTDDKLIKECSGVRCDAKVFLYIDNKKLEETGELQITNYGLSGICIFNISRDIKKNIDLNKKVVIAINFLSKLNIFDKKKAYEFFDEYFVNKTISIALDNLINYNLTNFLLKRLKINNNTLWCELNNKQKDELIDLLIAYKVNIIDTNSFDNAQTCRGGVPLTQINVNTLESKIVNGLYIVGELLDIDGDCGGYNLTWAFISGILAGSDIKND